MPDLREKHLLTTGDVARICHVAPRTVSKWFDTGKLRGFRIPLSRERRIPMENLICFMHEYGLPLTELRRGPCRVLAVGADGLAQMKDRLAGDEAFDVHLTCGAFEAGLLTHRLRPDVLVVDLDSVAAQAPALCRDARRSSGLQARIIIVGSPSRRGDLAELGLNDNDQWLVRPYTIEQLIESVKAAAPTLQ
ncbi:MAG: helix-turn-helix domain-containing protein [Planctomycetaceae bacterium]|nr:helix-turn-helix domain-containing protein [Planctomycetaceae bacterium]